MKADKIIVAVSLDPDTHEPLTKLKDIGFSENAEFHLVHIIPVPSYPKGMQSSLLTYPLPDERPEMEEYILKRLDQMKETILPQYSKVKCVCLFDSDEKTAFSEYAANQHADLVIAATRVKVGQSNLFDSSFAQHQLKHSQANILILR